MEQLGKVFAWEPSPENLHFCHTMKSSSKVSTSNLKHDPLPEVAVKPVAPRACMWLLERRNNVTDFSSFKPQFPHS